MIPRRSLLARPALLRHAPHAWMPDRPVTLTVPFAAGGPTDVHRPAGRGRHGP